MPPPRLPLRVEHVPDERVPTIELVPALALRYPMHAFLEVDVTEARERLARLRGSTGRSWSFTAFVIGCLGRAVAEHPHVQAHRRGRRLLVPERVDVATLVEVEADGHRVPLPHVLRDAARRPPHELHEELHAVRHERRLVGEVRRQTRWVLRLPRPLRSLLWRPLARSVRLRTSFGGTVVVSSIGSVVGGRGWGVSGLVSYPVSLTLGGVHAAPVLGEGTVEERQRLCLTVSLDHEVVDGAPAARFVGRLVELIEAAHGLPVADAPPSPVARPPAPDVRG